MYRLIALVTIPTLAVAVLSGGGVLAQEASPAASPVAVPPLLQQAVDAINAGDSAAVAALYTEDGIHEDIPAGVRVHGRDQIAAFVNEALGQRGDFRFEPVSGRQAGNLAVLEYTSFATDPASGRPVTYHGVLISYLEGDLIRHSADYYDLASVLRQLGLLELDEAAPPTAETATPTTGAAAGSAEAEAVSLTEFATAMPTELAARPTTVEITNDGTSEHNFEIEGQAIEEELPENLAPGQSGMLALDLAPGTYEVYCPVGDHEDRGQRLELSVTA